MSVSFIAGRLFVDAALLGILIFVVARHNAERELFHLLVVAAGTAIGGLVSDAVLAPAIGPLAYVVVALLCGALLIFVTGTNPVQAAIIVALFFAVKIGVSLALAYVFSNT